MSPRERKAGPREAGQHLAKAAEYLDDALAAQQAKRYSAAVSNAVIAGVNASDVICIGGRGTRSDNNDHSAAVELLRLSGTIGQAAADHLAALLPFKNLAQYSAVRSTPEQAGTAIDHAEELVELARRAAANIPGT